MELMQFDDNYLSILFLIVLVVLIVQLIVNYLSSRKTGLESSAPIKVISVVRCIKGDYSAEREFREGDFVGKIEGSCPKCGADLVIDRIYAVTVLQPGKQGGKKIG